MQRKSRLTVLSVVLIIMALAMGPANAQAPHGPEVAGPSHGAIPAVSTFNRVWKQMETRGL
jgi:hypothetical protein